MHTLCLQAELGEGPTWLQDIDRLGFVDIEGKRIHIWDPAGGELKTISTEDYGRPSTLSPTHEVHVLLAAIEQSVYLVDIQSCKVCIKLAHAWGQPSQW